MLLISITTSGFLDNGKHVAGAHDTARTRRELIVKGMTSAVVDQHAERLEATIRRYLREHLSQVRQVARFNSFERLFSLRHLVHVPAFVMMILSGLFHVLAVHLY